MSQRRFQFILLILSLIFAGCAVVLPPLNPVSSEDRTVNSVSDQQKNVIFNQSMVWYDSLRKTRGILFPEGKYQLEAEDNEYYYFKAPKELEYRIFENGKTTDMRTMPGGLYLSKSAFNMVPAGAYLSVSDEKKTLTWKLGSDFMRMENDEWKKDY